MKAQAAVALFVDYARTAQGEVDQTCVGRSEEALHLWVLFVLYFAGQM